MPWQDIAITSSSIIFSLSLFPQVYYGFKNKVGGITVATSAPTFVCLFLISFAYFTLDLYFSAITTVFTGILWLLLFIQRLMYKKTM